MRIIENIYIYVYLFYIFKFLCVEGFLICIMVKFYVINITNTIWIYISLMTYICTNKKQSGLIALNCSMYPCCTISCWLVTL